MHYIGVDIIEIARIEKAIARWGQNFLTRVFTEPELKLYHNKPASLAVRFAGKEAVLKAIGTDKKSIRWKDIEILSDPNGRPLVHLYGKAKTQAEKLGLVNLAISLSHSKEQAIALAIGETNPSPHMSFPP